MFKNAMKNGHRLSYLSNQRLQQSLYSQRTDLQALWVPFEIDVCGVNGCHVHRF